MTIVIFVAVIIPQQKKTFIQNLYSKAHSVATSLRDVTAGAALNEDYASIVAASETLLEGDPGLDSLIIIKNDGFSIISEQEGWRAEEISDAFFLPATREAFGTIQEVPLLGRRVFHYAQPFEYSGIEWGWIHVGLSLENYDQSVKDTYTHTMRLAFLCVFISFLVSLVYAKRLVRPIHHLRDVVQEVAEGNLGVRADGTRSDELGDLGESVNIMIESLLRRDRIMESVRFASQQLLLKDNWEDALPDILSKIGQATDLSRVYVFKNHLDNDGRLLCSQRNEWVAPGIEAQLGKPFLQNICYSDINLGNWVDQLSANQPIYGRVADLSDAEKAMLEPQDVLSILVVPIFFEDSWWGFLGLDDCKMERLWSDADRDSLHAFADLLGANHSRQIFQKALMESKATLEHRVDERTQELQNQVKAKEKALSELAEAQSSLVQMSRAAGMAEVATGVLHNVGNILNSVNVSCTLIRDQLEESRVGNLSKVAAMLTEQKEGLAQFLTDEPKGQQIPTYLVSLGSALKKEHQTISREAESLCGRIEHIKEIVNMQQNYGHVLGVEETIAPEQLMEDALTLNSGSLARHDVTVNREYEPVAPVSTDKHKVLQILLNLINNAKHACDTNNDREKSITLRIFPSDSNSVSMVVTDNGMGIAPENLTRIFQHGFTTGKTGHGFGLHSGALAAKELGGSLTVHSDGPDLGATFTLQLPHRAKE